MLIYTNQRGIIMDSQDEKYLILEQYRIYSDAKEKFIERQFATNRFYLVLNLIILLIAYLVVTLTPQYQAVVVLCIAGIATTMMWWMNIDSYQLLIRVKYASVLEYLETKLPEQPYHKEYVTQEEIKKKNRRFILFGDFQKVFTFILASVYFILCVYCITNMIKYARMGY